MRPLLLAALCGMMLALGCAKEPPPDTKKNPPRRIFKPGEKPGDKPAESKPSGS
jgi:hypothetical protein